MKLRKKHKQETEIFTDTLVDILFIGMMFFMIVAATHTLKMMKLNNPRASSDTKTNQKNIAVSVDKDQNFYIGKTKVANEHFDSLLHQEILKYKQLVDTPSVIINADTAAYYGEVFRIMRIAKKDTAKVVAIVK
ncbi:MAG TPA: biopolymer transporter ExbD [Chitinophagaceae bacterium]|jgi:biopolymer transport protein ExbD|nr:biopolymer transporter ExbD [Chitinophagaceae bacterium]OPZ17670.1 MAG: biopolymer transport protein ExbD [Bacteroidetes bacterium ADurb.BinA245]HMW67538.1 biopolymer transporter ExbD [Chitinophagaceae bacterium]HMX76850.1 biopolymer transporter ExbD [Chitinophagaceae bacterium]HNA19384.1 biopolymer transporter ExbD [Chitinophagaceae bacterium]